MDDADRGGSEPVWGAECDLGFVRNKGLGELGAVDGVVFLGRDDGDGALEALFSESLNSAHCSTASVRHISSSALY